MPRKNKRTAEPPPAPANGAGYVLVQTKEGVYWRRKRGSIKKAVLNDSFKKNAEATAMASPAAKRMFSKLEHFLRGLDTGRFIANVSSRLKKAWLETGEMDFSYMNNYDLQPWHPLENLLKESFSIKEKNNELNIHIPIHKHTVKRHNRLVTDYYFEAILVWGHVSKTKGLKIESDTSPLYSFEDDMKRECKLRLSLPTQNLPWLLILKLSCHEGNEPARHPRYYGGRVVGVGKC